MAAYTRDILVRLFNNDFSCAVSHEVTKVPPSQLHPRLLILKVPKRPFVTPSLLVSNPGGASYRRLLGRGVLTTPPFFAPFCRSVRAQSTAQPWHIKQLTPNVAINVSWSETLCLVYHFPGYIPFVLFFINPIASHTPQEDLEGTRVLPFTHVPVWVEWKFTILLPPPCYTYIRATLIQFASLQFGRHTAQFFICFNGVVFSTGCLISFMHNT